MIRSELDVLLDRVQDEALRADLRTQIDRLKQRRSFGLVFEQHIPERVRLPQHPIRIGSEVVSREDAASPTYEVVGIEDGYATVELVRQTGLGRQSSIERVCKARREIRIIAGGLPRSAKPTLATRPVAVVSQPYLGTQGRSGTLKWSLLPRGVTAFVAHEDIEPTQEWQAEIETALRSMDAMAALLTADFHSSNWTDHEVGYALGQGTLVVAVQLPSTPYGFTARNQGLRGDLSIPGQLATAIVGALLRRSETAARMREALVTALESSNSYASTKAAVLSITATEGFSGEQLDRMEEAIPANDQVGGYFSIDRLTTYIEAHR